MQVFCQAPTHPFTSAAFRRRPLPVRNLPPTRALRAPAAWLSKSYRPSAFVLALLLWLGQAHAAAPVQIAEPHSGEHFQSPLAHENSSYILVGTGLFKRQTTNVYAMALYVDESARQSFIGVYDRASRRHANLFVESRAQNFFTWGHFHKLCVLHYLSGLTAEELQQGFRDGLSELLTAQAPAELHKDALAFIALFDTEVKPAQELRIATDDVGHIEVFIDGKKKTGPHSPKLCRHIWDIWLGFHPVSPAMRQSLLERLDVLAQ
jgi:hypothetical protein